MGDQNQNQNQNQKQKQKQNQKQKQKQNQNQKQKQKRNQNQNQNQNSKPHHTDKALGYQVELLGSMAETLTLSQLKAAGEYMAGMRRIKAGGGHKKKSAAMLLKKLEESGIDAKTIEQIEKKKLAARLKRKRIARENRRGRMK